ncbi:hypothetical protein [Pontibacter ramchanderi]|uniref:Uncharacterized protein n=1 Tax=Pontibacter ramchanderi TaxID=1179743 RepID=A0A2N3V2V9_9BACT|nr:hypothetical protein [Pontibacter ramchanderi]PKV75957.1 hypothetical protein BD749_0905 [Pontibacter ramchanderi]
MDSDVLKILLEHEEKVRQNIGVTFSIRLNGKGMLLQEGEQGAETEVVLPHDLHQTLMTFFNSNECVSYRSSNYNMLKSLLSAHACLNRMKNK